MLAISSKILSQISLPRVTDYDDVVVDFEDDDDDDHDHDHDHDNEDDDGDVATVIYVPCLSAQISSLNI